MAKMSQIPISLLKTRSIPHDSYEEYFSTPDSLFVPSFVPVLEHQLNEENLQSIKTLLRTRALNEKYGGMIFTSQRAVEAFAHIVEELEQEQQQEQQQEQEGPEADRRSMVSPFSSFAVHFSANGQYTCLHIPIADTPATPVAYALTSPFPLYVVGPATSRTLHTLITTSPLLSPLNCSILGSASGTGESLAHFILLHYNHAHYAEYFARYEAPRLPFVPLVGNRSEQYPRLERDDQRLRKRPLLFLVGEQRRDVIPRTLTSQELPESRRVEVQEVEVYRTGVMAGFEADFREWMQRCRERSDEVVVVVVFSPAGCGAMLRVLGWLDGEGKATQRAKGSSVVVVVSTIGPTTRDYLYETFALEADVCARTPSPEGIGEGVMEFLRARGMLQE